MALYGPEKGLGGAHRDKPADDTPIRTTAIDNHY